MFDEISVSAITETQLQLTAQRLYVITLRMFLYVGDLKT